MGKFGLQFKATLENVTNVRPVGDDFRWFLKLKCGNCGEVPDKWQYVTLADSVPLKGGRGSASMVLKCKLCARENSIDILGETIKPYNDEDSERFKTMVQFECRGLEPIDFQPQAGFAAQGAESGTQFPEINLQEKDWTDYDEKVRESVGIYEVVRTRLGFINMVKAFFTASIKLKGLGGFIQQVCCLTNSGPPTALLCRQHGHFFWRKWKSSHYVVHPAPVRPAYAVPKHIVRPHYVGSGLVPEWPDYIEIKGQEQTEGLARACQLARSAQSEHTEVIISDGVEILTNLPEESNL